MSKVIKQLLWFWFYEKFNCYMYFLVIYTYSCLLVTLEDTVHVEVIDLVLDLRHTIKNRSVIISGVGVALSQKYP